MNLAQQLAAHTPETDPDRRAAQILTALVLQIAPNATAEQITPELVVGLGLAPADAPIDAGTLADVARTMIQGSAA